jgi:glycosyltransferase involved in cell wall biosynthesis
VRELLEAFCRLKPHFAGLTLIMVGDGSYRGQILSKAVEARAAEAVVVTGRVLQEDVADYLAIADIFVLPSYDEGMPNALLEAMASGLPCIATEVGGNPEALENGVSGILIPPRDVDALERAIVRIVRNPDSGARLAGAASKKIRSHFSWRANAEANLAVYRTLLGGPKNTAGGKQN